MVVARPQPHGWFEIDGVQTGERTLAEQVVGLEPLLAEAKGASVLDVACAEGMVGKWLLDHGAASVRGLEGHAPYVETGRAVAEQVQFYVVDLNDVPTWAALIEERYDIVLALNILHKLSDPARALRELAKRTGNMLALSLPDDVVRDRRSSYLVMDPAAVLGDAFERVSVQDAAWHHQKGFYGRRTIFRRRRKSA